MRSRLDVFANVALVCASLIVGASYLGDLPIPFLRKDAFERFAAVDGWKTLQKSGADVVGDDASPIQMIVFSDIQCPFCRELHEDVAALDKRRKNAVHMSFLHFPLKNHELAIPAAVAAECAAAQGRRAQMLDALFARQDSLGLIPWRTLAVRAGVSDFTEFDKCVETANLEQIYRQRTIGDSLKVTYTPTVIVNGRRWAGRPTSADLDSILGKSR